MDSESENDDVLLYPEAAELLRVSRRSLERLVHENRVPYTPLPGRGTRRQVRFLKSELLMASEAEQSEEVRVTSRKRKLPRGLFWRDGILHIRYSEDGHIFRESTDQTTVRFAQEMRMKRLTEVAEKKLFPSRQFGKVRFNELLDYWWEHHGRNTKSHFECLLDRKRESSQNLGGRKVVPQTMRIR